MKLTQQIIKISFTYFIFNLIIKIPNENKYFPVQVGQENKDVKIN